MYKNIYKNEPSKNYNNVFVFHQNYFPLLF